MDDAYYYLHQFSTIFESSGGDHADHDDGGDAGADSDGSSSVAIDIDVDWTERANPSAAVASRNLVLLPADGNPVLPANGYIREQQWALARAKRRAARGLDGGGGGGGGGARSPIRDGGDNRPNISSSSPQIESDRPSLESIEFAEQLPLRHMLARALHDTGRSAYGVVAISVSILTDGSGDIGGSGEGAYLEIPHGGFWVDPAFLHSTIVTSGEGGDNGELLRRLVDEAREDYLPPSKVLPGQGLPGVLWVEAKGTARRRRMAVVGGEEGGGGTTFHGFRSATLRRSSATGTPTPADDKRRRNDNRGSVFQSWAATGRTLRDKLLGGFGGEDDDCYYEEGTTTRRRRRLSLAVSRKLEWRDVQHLAVDPDQPPDIHLRQLAKAGIGLAAGVRFNIHGHEGIVVYMARGAVDRRRLQSRSNSRLLRHAAYVIGSIGTFGEPFAECLSERILERDAAYHRARCVLTSRHRRLRRKGQAEIEEDEEEEKDDADGAGAGAGGRGEDRGDTSITISVPKDRRHLPCTSPTSAVGDFVRDETTLLSPSTWWTKCLGSDTTCPPPPIPWGQSAFAFLGSFVTLLSWSAMNVFVIDRSDDRFTLMRGSMGSLVAAQFLLMAAPAAQPRNAFFAELVTGVVAYSINYIPRFPVWIREALTPSIVIAAMGKLGIIHPTAGGDALLYAANGTLQWDVYGFVLSNYAFAILLATAINNISRMRQYPIYWAPFPFLRGKVERIKAFVLQKT